MEDNQNAYGWTLNGISAATKSAIIAGTTVATGAISLAGFGNNGSPGNSKMATGHSKMEMEDNQQNPRWWNRILNRSTATQTAIVGGATVIAPTAATGAIGLVGFGGGGVVGGSIAAGIQAGMGNVVAGSTFAALQSVGATGGFAILGPVGLVGGAVALGGVGAYHWYKSSRTEKPLFNSKL